LYANIIPQGLTFPAKFGLKWYAMVSRCCFILRFTLHLAGVYVNLYDLLVDFISFLPSSCYDDISVIVDNYYGSPFWKLFG
jgi:hypothetical protein